jgi:hypothetical protein
MKNCPAPVVFIQEDRFDLITFHIADDFLSQIKQAFVNSVTLMLESYDTRSDVISYFSSQADSQYRIITQDNSVFKMTALTHFFHVFHELGQVYLVPSREVSE